MQWKIPIHSLKLYLCITGAILFEWVIMSFAESMTHWKFVVFLLNKCHIIIINEYNGSRLEHWAYFFSICAKNPSVCFFHCNPCSISRGFALYSTLKVQLVNLTMDTKLQGVSVIPTNYWYPPQYIYFIIRAITDESWVKKWYQAWPYAIRGHGKLTLGHLLNKG